MAGELACPVPLPAGGRILLAHGGGGRLTRELVEGLFVPAFRNEALAALHDSAVLDVPAGRLAFTTDSFVVRPMFFPGGDVGSLAVNGTVNDLAMSGARPLYLSLGFILEEGLAVEDLARVVDSIRTAARDAAVVVATGDTKVVERGKGDGVYITSSGVGVVVARESVTPARVRPGDAVIVSGPVGQHGVAVMAVRDGLKFSSPIVSDCASVAAPALALIEAGLDVHCLRDPTRGGVATVLNEIATQAGCEIAVHESAVPVNEDVAGACEVLGLDPLYVACEGRFLAFVPAPEADAALALLHGRADTARAARIGTVREGATPGLVTLKTVAGGERVLDLLSGEQLPRIC
ncbi:MAG TPA: hydrogenase expression/formation protein HypE [Gemmatimonadales bacterium]|nr:hydrogenase expression/formation protein HypE [Gemmatimonadales bacterium]